MKQLREVANSVPRRQFVKRGSCRATSKVELENFVRDAATTYWHETCTAKMVETKRPFVDGRLNVYGVDNLRSADGSIMPRITTRNPMAPCVIIGERAEILVVYLSVLQRPDVLECLGSERLADD